MTLPIKIRTTLGLIVAVAACWASSPLAARQTQDATLAGCLHAAGDTGDFTLVTDDQERYQVQATEGVDLAPHANHRVELTGIIEKNELTTSIKATALKMVSASCDGWAVAGS